jgi:hypothetical protein
MAKYTIEKQKISIRTAVKKQVIKKILGATAAKK